MLWQLLLPAMLFVEVFYSEINMIHIGFTGTREKISEAQRQNLQEFLLSFVECEDEIVCHHGDCIGADTEFHNICSNLGLKIVIHPPKVQDLRAFNKSDSILPEKSYFARNRDIVDNSDLLLGVPIHYIRNKGGTWYTINYAISNKKKVVLFDPLGEVIEYNF